MRKWKRGALVTALTAVAVASLAGVGVASAETTPGAPAAAPASNSSVAANIRVVREFLQDVIEEHHGSDAANYLTSDVVFHAGTVGTFTGSTAVAGLFNTLVTAFPDMHSNVEDIFGSGNEVLLRLDVNAGAQKAALLNIPASGRNVQWTEMDLFRLQDGKISEEWADPDWTAILNDTGTYKAPWIP
jgi:predicted ester cyclase